MIVRKHNKGFERNNMFPNTNWYEDEDNFVIDETTPQGKHLADKIEKHAPYFEFVVQDGQLIDITPIDPPPVEEMPVEETPVNPLEEKVVALEKQVAELSSTLHRLMVKHPNI